jgi:hypothetical protein
MFTANYRDPENEGAPHDNDLLRYARRLRAAIHLLPPNRVAEREALEFAAEVLEDLGGPPPPKPPRRA